MAIRKIITYIVIAIIIAVGCYIIFSTYKTNNTHITTSQNSSTTPTTTNSGVSISTSSPQTTHSNSIVSESNNNKTVNLHIGDEILLKLNSQMKWTVTTPSVTILTSLSTTSISGVQGIYVAKNIGITDLHAEGRPICKSEMCAQYIVNFVVHIAVSK